MSQAGRWDRATTDDMRLVKSLSCKTVAQENDLRKTVDTLNRERRSFLSKFNDKKARIFRRFNEIKADRTTTRMRLNEAVEAMGNTHIASPGQVGPPRPNTTGGIGEQGSSTAAWINQSDDGHFAANTAQGLNALEDHGLGLGTWKQEDGLGTHNTPLHPGGQEDGNDPQEVAGTTATNNRPKLNRPFSSPAIRIHSDSGAYVDAGATAGIYPGDDVFLTSVTPPAARAVWGEAGPSRGYLSVPGDADFDALGAPYRSRSLNSLNLSSPRPPRRGLSANYNHLSSDEDLVSVTGSTPPSSRSFLCTTPSAGSSSRRSPSPLRAAAGGRGGSMAKAGEGCMLPEILQSGGNCLVGPGSPRSPNYHSKSMSALQLSPRLRTRSGGLPPSPHARGRVSPGVVDVAAGVGLEKSGVVFNFGDYPNKGINTAADPNGSRLGGSNNMSPTTPGGGGAGGGGPVGGGGGSGGGTTSSSNPQQARGLATGDGPSTGSFTQAGGPNSNRKAPAHTGPNLCHSPGQVRSTAGSSRNSSRSSRDSSPGTGSLSSGVDPASLERRISLAMAKAMSVDNRANSTSKRTPEELDFYRRALSGSKLPVSPGDIRRRSATYSSGDVSNLRKKAAAAAAKAKLSVATNPDVITPTKLPGAKTTTIPQLQKLTKAAPKSTGSTEIPVSAPAPCTTSAPSGTGMQREAESRLLSKPEIEEVAEEVEVCDLGEDWQLQATPFRRRSVTFSGLGNKPIQRLPEIIERSPTPDTMASFSTTGPLNLTIREAH